jgi:cytochrome c-type biogenesis protein CcmH
VIARLTAALLIAAFALPALAAQAPDLEGQARAIESRLVAPCCFRQQVSEHQSGAADEMRADIRARLRRGETESAILDAYVARYGPKVLAQPPARGFALSLYVLPVLLLLGTASVLTILIRRFAGRGARPPGLERVATEPAFDRRAQQRLDDELRDLD